MGVSCHIETVVVLSREKVDGYVGIDLDVEKLNSKSGIATYEDIKTYIEQKDGFKVSTLYIAQVKDKVGLEKQMTFKDRPAKGRVPNCPPEKEAAIMDAFRHFGMI